MERGSHHKFNIQHSTFNIISMKPATLLNIVLAIALVIVSARWAMSESHSSDKGAFADSTAVSVQATDSVFEEFDVTKDFRGNPFTYFKGKGLLLAVGDKADHNEMTIGWGALGNIWESGMSLMTVYVAPGRYTFKYMEKAKYFTVMEFDDAHKDILEYMGTHSGRDGDKAKALGLHTLYTEHGTPYFEEAKTVFECEMIYHAPFDPKGFGEMPKELYSNFPAGIHSMYMGKIVKAMRK